MYDEKQAKFSASFKDQYMTTVKVGTKEQIVIPNEVRDLLNIKSDDVLLLCADSQRGMAIQPFYMFKDLFTDVFYKTENHSTSR
jgi:AbrB family looped-hinge helix DNA binding protein